MPEKKHDPQKNPIRWLRERLDKSEPEWYNRQDQFEFAAGIGAKWRFYESAEFESITTLHKLLDPTAFPPETIGVVFGITVIVDRSLAPDIIELRSKNGDAVYTVAGIKVCG